MKALSADTLLARVLHRLALAIIRHPRWFFWPQVFLAMVCVVITIAFLRFDPDQSNLVSPTLKYQQNFLHLQKEFPQQGNDLDVVVQSDDPEKNRQFIERLAAKMIPETNLFSDVFYEHDLAAMGTEALFFVPQEDLSAIKTTLHDELPFIAQFTQTTNLPSFFEEINAMFRNSSADTNAQTDAMIQSLPFLTGILNQATTALQSTGKPVSPGVASLFGATDLSDIYITLAHGHIFLLRTHPPVSESDSTLPTMWSLIKGAISSKPSPNGDVTGAAIDRLRELIKETQAEVPGVNVGLTGEPVLDYDQMTSSQKDTTLASIVSLVLCALIFIYGYNETGRPIKSAFCLVIGLCYTLAFAALTVGHLNVLTITFVPMLIGLAIDFGVHLITRYEEGLRHGQFKKTALMKAMVYTGQGIFTGAFTTAGAFIAMIFTNFRGIQEMGIICGGGLLLCLVPMLTMLPVMLMRGRQNVMDHEIKEDLARARIENTWLERPAVVIGVTLFLCALSATQIYKHKINFNYDLIEMQSPSLSSVVFQHLLANSAGQSALPGAVVATNLENAIALSDKIKKLPTVATIEPSPDVLENFIQSNQVKKLPYIRGIKKEVSPLSFRPPDLQPVNLNDFSATLYSLYGYCGAALAQIGTNDPALSKQLVTLRDSIENLRRAMLSGDAVTRAGHSQTLAEFQQAFFNNVRTAFDSLKDENIGTLEVTSLPAPARDQFVGKNGEFLLQVFPKADIWQRTNQAAFIADLRTADPNVTGAPVQLYEYESLLKDSYIQAAWYSLIAIAILIFIHFRSLLAVFLALLPVAIGTLWLAGMMGMLNIQFNLANIMTLPLVIGVGVTNGIQILNRFAEERTPGILSRSTGKAVLVSGLTAIAGFGSLILAKHRGIHSLGVVMAMGLFLCMIAALTFLPAFLNLLGRWRPLIKE
ncbi:MAG TPA: MMPL family transporter [Pseudomonadales bacterium]|nr:MMPL family transporter [Pseudomonadales bacterium]